MSDLKSFVNTTRGTYGVGFIILLIMLSLSFALRQHEFNQVTGARNLEATYHTLLTIKALNESPAKDHLFLPIVSLGKDSDKGIPWGATVPTENGDYIYTSFTPPGFLAPYFVFSIFDAEPTIKNLARFNFFLGAVVSLLLFTLLSQVLTFIGHRPSLSVGGALAGSSIAVFSREALQSHGTIYWSQSLFQLVFIVALWSVFKYLTDSRNQSRRNELYAMSIVGMAFFSASTEWTGYIFNFGLLVLFWFGIPGVRASKWLAVGIAFATMLAGILTLVHYSSAVGVQTALGRFLSRYADRNAAAGNLHDLLAGYGLSFGVFVFIVAVLIGYNLVSIKQRVVFDKPTCACSFSVFGMKQFLKFVVSQFSKVIRVMDNRYQKVFFIVVAASFPLLENILLLQHAGQFSFDRLKFIFPAALIIAVSYCRLPGRLRYFLGFAVLLASVQGFQIYKNDLQLYESWADIDAENRDLILRVSEKLDTRCAVFLSNIQVRGYASLLVGRGMYEAKHLDDSMELMKLRKSCAAVYLEGGLAYTDLPRYTKVIVTFPDRASFELSSRINSSETKSDAVLVALFLFLLLAMGIVIYTRTRPEPDSLIT